MLFHLLSIYYLSLQASPRIKIDDRLYKILQRRLEHEEVTDKIFDEVQHKVSTNIHLFLKNLAPKLYGGMGAVKNIMN